MCSQSNVKNHMLLMALVIIGAINWGGHALGYNFVDILSNQLNKLFKSKLPINDIIYIVVAIAGLILASKRSTWLPFLGKTVLPDSLIPLKVPTTTPDKTVQIKTLPNVKVAYWAALNKGDKTNVMKAYGNYENSGVVMSDANGVATFPIMTGTGYTLPSGKILPRHVHYRVIGSPHNYSMIGKVQTINY